MREVEIYDSSGEELYQLTQWDQEVHVTLKVHTDVLSESGSCQVHFFSKGTNESYVVYTTYTITDDLLATECKIPNIILTDPYAVNGHLVLYFGNENEEIRAVYKFRIPIVKKPRPTNYVDYDSDDYITIAQILAECQTHAEHSSESETNAREYRNSASASEANALASKNLAQSAATSASQSLVEANSAANLSRYYADSAEQSAEDAAAAAGSNLFSVGINPTTGLLCIYYNGEDEIEPGPYPRPQPDPTPPPDPELDDNNT